MSVVRGHRLHGWLSRLQQALNLIPHHGLLAPHFKITLDTAKDDLMKVDLYVNNITIA
jgi:hypothetical protein